MSSNIQGRNFAVYLAELSSGQGENFRGSPTKTTHTNEQENRPFVITWHRGVSVSYCVGTNKRKSSPNVAFRNDLTQAKTFATITAAYEFLRKYFSKDSFIKKMLDTGKFHISKLETLTAHKSSIEAANNALLGDSTGAQSAPCAATS